MNRLDPALPLASERAVYRAMFEYLDEAIVLEAPGELALDASDGRYRFVDGVCFQAPQPAAIGAHLCGWLIETERASAVMSRFRTGARAVLCRSSGVVQVSAPARTLLVDGEWAPDGFATHVGHFVVVHGDDVVDRRSSIPPVESAAVSGRGDSPSAPEIEVDLCDLEPEDDEVPVPTPSPDREPVVERARSSHPPADSYRAPPGWGPLPPLVTPPRREPLPTFDLDLDAPTRPSVPHALAACAEAPSELDRDDPWDIHDAPATPPRGPDVSAALRGRG
jgi:hypothetical protein